MLRGVSYYLHAFSLLLTATRELNVIVPYL